MCTLKQNKLFKGLSIILIISFLLMDVTMANPDIYAIKTSTLAVPSIFVNNIGLKLRPLSLNLSSIDEAKLCYSIKNISEYFFEVSGSCSKERERYVAAVMRRELKVRGVDIAPGINLDSIKFESGIIHIVYENNGKEYHIKIDSNHNIEATQKITIDQLTSLKEKFGVTIIGITGPPASGKSVALKAAEKAGYTTIEVDEILRKNLPQKLQETLKTQLGNNVINIEGGINYAVALKDENFPIYRKLIQPFFNATLSRQVKEAIEEKESIVVLECAYLDKLSIRKIVDETWFITRNPKKRAQGKIKRGSQSNLKDAKKSMEQLDGVNDYPEARKNATREIENNYKTKEEFVDYFMKELNDASIKTTVDKQELVSNFVGIQESILKINKMIADNGVGQTVRIGFDRGLKDPEIFSFELPNIDHSDADQAEFISKYVVLELYNRAGIYGANKMLVSCSSELFEGIHKVFYQGVDGDKSKGYHLMEEYFNLVYGANCQLKHVNKKVINALERKQNQRNIDANPKKGKIIGIDIGKSDVKAIASINGEVKATVRFDWSPEQITNTKEHLLNIKNAIEKVKAEASMTDIDAIGISINLAVVDNKVTGTGPVLNGVIESGKYKKKKFKKQIYNMADIFGKEFNAPVFILNDGDAAAVQVSVDMQLPSTLALSLGSGLAGGFVDNKNMVTDWLTEMGNVVIDTSDDAPGHSFSKVKGASQRYLSQRAVFRLAEMVNLELLGDTEAAKLRDAQNKFENGTKEEKEKTKKIFMEIAQYIATYAQTTNQILNEKNMILFGRVTEGQAGKYMLAQAQRLAQQQGVNVNIMFPDIPNITQTQEKLIQTHGQAIGAAYHASSQMQGKEDYAHFSAYAI